MTMAIWCLFLMIPGFRHPNTVMMVMCLPAAYFYLRAENRFTLFKITTPEIARSYRNSCATLCFILLALYASKGIFQMILFPEAVINTNHYHYNAPLIFALGLLLLRLRGLGATDWTALYGGLSLMVGTYFSLTAFPGLTPFSYPVRAAWSAIALTPLFFFLINFKLELKLALQKLAKLDNAQWLNHQVIWNYSLLIGSQFLVLLGLLQANDNTYAFAPLLLGGATLFAHIGLITKKRLHLFISCFLFLLSLHADFFLQSYISKENIVVVLLTLWAGLLAVDHFAHKKLSHDIILKTVTFFLVLCFCHILYLNPWTSRGLTAMFFAGVLWSITPCQNRRAVGQHQESLAALLLFWPSWMIYFTHVLINGEGASGLLRTGPLLGVMASFLILGALARNSQRFWATTIDHWNVKRYRLLHQTVDWLIQNGELLFKALLWLVFISLSILQILHYGTAYSGPQMVLFVLLWLGMAIAWFVDGKDNPSIQSNILWQLSVLGLFALLRRQLMLSVDWWLYEYDVWISLAVSAILAGAKSWLNRQSRQLQVSVLGTLFTLPAAALIWTVIHGLGTDVALTVVGLQSLLFGYLGRDNPKSGYNVVSIVGFVSFILILFSQNLEFKVVHAYVIPVGIGLLVLLQLFGQDIKAQTRNQIRLVILLSMLGSSAYYALMDERYPVEFNLTLIVLGLAAMICGSILRVRLYLLLGATGILVDLASLFYKIVVRMDRTYRMTLIGLLLLVLGIAVVGGAVYFKSNRKKVEAWLTRLRERLGIWE